MDGPLCPPCRLIFKKMIRISKPQKFLRKIKRRNRIRKSRTLYQRSKSGGVSFAAGIFSVFYCFSVSVGPPKSPKQWIPAFDKTCVFYWGAKSLFADSSFGILRSNTFHRKLRIFLSLPPFLLLICNTLLSIFDCQIE